MAEWIRMEEALGENDIRLFSRGDTVQGRVVHVTENEVLVDIGYKSEAVLPKEELAPGRDKVAPGDLLEVLITYIDEENGTVYISERQAFFAKKFAELEQAYRAGAPVKGTVVAEVPGAGYQVDLGGIRAFLPASHLGKGLSPKFERLRGRTLEFKIIEFSRRTRNLVVSRKEWLREKEERAKDALFASLTPGKVVEGVVKSVVDFGIFVDVGGHDGLVHRTEICWKDIPAPPPGKFRPGQRIKVMVLEADRKEERISLSIKRLRPNPWEGLAQRYPVGAKVKGKVVSVTDFGAFVELEEDVEGLVHVSELSWAPVKHPKEVVQPGQEVEVVVLAVNEAERRISLSLRKALPDPWEDVEHRYPKGALVEGVVTNVTDFGAFVQLEPGIEGLVHVSELSWERVAHPKDVVQPGQKVRAMVLKVDAQNRRISLSLKALQQDPWEEFLEQYSVGSVVSGPVTQIKEFGAFVRITPAVEGLIHVSEISHERIGHPQEVLRLGQEVTAKIIGINEAKRQVRLSIKKLQEDLAQAETEKFLATQPVRETITLRERLRELGMG
ncbi:30S ribosomal protein S1 [Thermus sp.]|uniref:30S ribosomal protein S1 n=1 Tax=Thermus sp. TaxID=275 RepID=UPI00263A00F0|nr:30S ribosomal protein S1 [Thermus sp.]MCS7216276.1 30S ribosomal protein S1 [Candidatus Bipolaricaulota bacterium]MCX7850251.1 30S ribosomal protein S1 [Thermus sp.]MDW8151506.1 30S ribosomal protein S1 [Candidatus Bipolaricaulota bacterium]